MLSNQWAVLRKTLEQRLCQPTNLVVAVARGRGRGQGCWVNWGKRPWALGPPLSLSQRWCQSFLVSLRKNSRINDTQHGGQVTQTLKCIKVKVYSGDGRSGKRERERERARCCALWSLGFCFLLTVVNRGWRCRVSCVSFLPWSWVSCHGIPHLGLVWFGPASCRGLPGWASDFPDS